MYKCPWRTSTTMFQNQWRIRNRLLSNLWKPILILKPLYPQASTTFYTGTELSLSAPLTWWKNPLCWIQERLFALCLPKLIHTYVLLHSWLVCCWQILSTTLVCSKACENSSHDLIKLLFWDAYPRHLSFAIPFLKSLRCFPFDIVFSDFCCPELEDFYKCLYIV